ncbi:hypothetical protein CPB86DRAFT_798875 [Serendipita vermifera]|nr:hypothetical protein CPB86DRAFT_798875 [Serendipita vermifera]
MLATYDPNEKGLYIPIPNIEWKNYYEVFKPEFWPYVYFELNSSLMDGIQAQDMVRTFTEFVQYKFGVQESIELVEGLLREDPPSVEVPVTPLLSPSNPPGPPLSLGEPETSFSPETPISPSVDDSQLPLPPQATRSTGKFKCPDPGCEKSFSRRETMEACRDRHTGTKRFKCGGCKGLPCGRKFLTESELTRHQKGAKFCEACQKATYEMQPTFRNAKK